MNDLNVARRGVRAGGMLAGEVADVLGVGIQTLHYYEREGLITPPARSDAGYRLYSKDLVESIRFIRKAQALGFSLQQTKEVVELARKGTSPCGRVQAALAENLRELDRRLEELQTFRAELASLIEESTKRGARRRGARVCSIVEDAPPLPGGERAKPPLAPRRRRSRPRGLSVVSAP